MTADDGLSDDGLSDDVSNDATLMAIDRLSDGD